MIHGSVEDHNCTRTFPWLWVWLVLGLKSTGQWYWGGAMAVTSLLRNIRPPSHRPPPQVPPSCSPGISLPLQSGSALVLCWLNVLGAHKLLLLMFAFTFVSDVKPLWETRTSCMRWGFYSAAFFFFSLFPPHHSVVLINDLLPTGNCCGQPGPGKGRGNSLQALASCRNFCL